MHMHVTKFPEFLCMCFKMPNEAAVLNRGVVGDRVLKTLSLLTFSLLKISPQAPLNY